MMFAKPVVGCRSGGMPEVIEEAVTGLLAEPGDPVSLASAIGILLDDSERRRGLGQAGRERYLRLYTRDALVDRTLKFYREMLLRRAGQSNSQPASPHKHADHADHPDHRELVRTGSAQR